MIAALILAGGKGTRLADPAGLANPLAAGLENPGGPGVEHRHADKAFVQLAGAPLFDHLLARLAPQIRTIAISANGNLTRFASYALPILPDAPADAAKGPLAGVAAGLAWAKTIGAASLLTVPVDTPFIPADLATRLKPAPAVAVWQARQHHLVAHWPTAFLPALTDVLTRPGPHKVRDALTLAGARQVHFTEPQDPFLNINTPEDLARAERLFRLEKAAPPPGPPQR